MIRERLAKALPKVIVNKYSEHKCNFSMVKCSANRTLIEATRMEGASFWYLSCRQHICDNIPDAIAYLACLLTAIRWVAKQNQAVEL